jgi:hypothetical protein
MRLYYAPLVEPNEGGETTLGASSGDVLHRPHLLKDLVGESL